ncbi:MAG: hypothetical protein IKD14_00595 [Clostridia bacterium]|nr:hypothetical protein [Clostridia bacterium]
MKRILLIALGSVMLLTSALLVFVGCVDTGDIPTVAEVKTEFYTDDRLERTLNRTPREDLLKVWGQPDKTVAYENEDVWFLGDGRALVVSYTRGGRVDDVDIED